jgi:oxygen-independent coproporphyrinogen III oxidase
VINSNKLLEKYNVPVPRYTSYPTVPYWQDNIDTDRWKEIFGTAFTRFAPGSGIALYMHLPFCESLCTYCGCNKKITGNHSVEDAYINAIHNEWKLYTALMEHKPIIRELHLGGGTPTFFSPENLVRLLQPILEDAVIHPNAEFGFEGHPNNTTEAHLQTLYDLGFRRVSYGVQDNDPEVQRIINRIQPLENVVRAINTARSIGYKSVNFDLIYGLPGQTTASITNTINETIALRPDRIAFYSYAHVPWTSRGQRLFDETDLPSAQQKQEMYLTARELFLQNDYKDIGMDHFALVTDDLYIALSEGRLHRNFMGYTTHNTEILLGLGVSAISTVPGAFIQNDKSLHNYYAAINEGKSAAVKGIFTSEEDIRFGHYIMDIICNGTTEFSEIDNNTINTYSMPALKDFAADGLIHINNQTLTVTDTGRNYVRNICSALDLYLARKRVDERKRVFSNAV